MQLKKERTGWEEVTEEERSRCLRKYCELTGKRFEDFEHLASEDNLPLFVKMIEGYINRDSAGKTVVPISHYLPSVDDGNVNEHVLGDELYNSLSYNMEDVAGYFNGEVNFECLTKLQNKILSMYYLDKISKLKIARELGMSRGAVRWQFQKAIKILTTNFTNSEGK